MTAQIRKNWPKIIVPAVAICVFCLVVWLVGRAPVLVTEKSEYPAGTTSVTATVRHVWPGRYETGSTYTLERQDENETWVPVQKSAAGAFFTSARYVLGMKSTFTFDLTKYCDSLEAGTYRIQKTITDMETGEQIHLLCDFSVTGPTPAA